MVAPRRGQTTVTGFTAGNTSSRTEVQLGACQAEKRQEWPSAQALVGAQQGDREKHDIFKWCMRNPRSWRVACPECGAAEDRTIIPGCKILKSLRSPC